MEQTDTLQGLKQHKKVVDKAIEIVGELDKAALARPADILRAREQLRKLRQITQGLSLPQMQGNLDHWTERATRRVDAMAEEAKSLFGAELEQDLRSRGLSLTGNYPAFRVGLFTVEVNVDKASAKLWYGPRQEHITDCVMAPADVADKVSAARQNLGSRLPCQELLEKLYESCRRVVGAAEDGPVPIVKALSSLAYVLQDRTYHEDPSAGNYRGYGRADFSYDLFRLRAELLGQQCSGKLALSVASREETRDRSDFLWVPDDEQGKGTTYSHLRFERRRQ